MQLCNTYVELLKHVEQGTPNPKALNVRGENGSWQSKSTSDFLRDIRAVALGLKEFGLQRGDRVGIFAASSPDWTIADIAIVLAGGISVPIFTTISEENFVFEVKQTKTKFLFISGQEQWALYHRYEDQFTTAIALEDDQPENSKVKSLKALKLAGQRLDAQDPHLFADMMKALRPKDICTIIYTSGSTGVPKGVELTQENLVSGVGFTGFTWNPSTDRYLSVLPLEHVFGHCFNLWMLYHGVSIYYTHDHKHLAQICGEVRPTMIAVVPRLLEKVYAKMLEKVYAAPYLKRLIGRLAFHLASEPSSLLSKILHPLLNTLVYKKLKIALGGELRMFISGGAALSGYLQNFFETIGIPTYQGWGLTEACPLSTNTPEHHKSGSVGKLLPEHEVKISPAGEVLVKGPLVMHGYYEDPDKTALTIDSEGYLHTGDKGEVDSEGYLTLVGRLKELYKSSTGEYIAPVPIEHMIVRHPLIEMALVVAEGKRFASVLLFPNPEVIVRLKKSQNAESLSDEAFLENAYVQKEMKLLINEVNRHLNHPEQIRAFKFINEPLTIKGGELTPSMKIRRETVLKKYADVIDAIYNTEVMHG